MNEVIDLGYEIYDKFNLLTSGDIELVQARKQLDLVCRNYAHRKSILLDLLKIEEQIDNEIREKLEKEKPDPSEGNAQEYREKVQQKLGELGLEYIYEDYFAEINEVIENGGFQEAVAVQSAYAQGFNVINYISIGENGSLVRFSYMDNDEPIRNRYILYWKYEDNLKKGETDRLEQGETELYKRDNIMLPLGLGKTDDLGFLRQAMYVERSGNEKIQTYFHRDNGFVYVPPKLLPFTARLTEYPLVSEMTRLDPFTGAIVPPKKTLKPFSFDTDGKFQSNYDFVRPDWRDYLGLSDLYTRQQNLPMLLQQYETIQSYYQKYQLMVKLYPNRLFYLNSLFSNWAEIDINKSVLNSQFKDDVRESIIATINRSKNTQSFLQRVTQYSFDQTRRYGFLVYPGDLGAFQTKNVIELGNYHFAIKAKKGKDGNLEPSNSSKEYSVAYVGPVPKPPEDRRLEDYTPIALYCTLPEWEARLRFKTKKLQELIDQRNLAASEHIENLGNIGMMREFVKMLNDYPWYKHFSLVEKRNNLYNEINGLYDAIEEKVHNNDKDFALEGYDKAMDPLARELMNLLIDPGLTLELRHYHAYITKNKKDKIPSGPYMQKEEHWLGIFDAYEQALRALSATSLKEEVWKKVCLNVIEAFAEHENVADFVPSKSELEKINRIERDLRTSKGLPAVDVRYTIGARIGAIRMDTSTKDENKPEEKKGSETANSSTTKVIFKEIIESDPFQAITDFVKPSLDLVVAYPGPHSVAQAILSCFPEQVMRLALNQSQRATGTTRTARMFYGLLNCFFPFRSLARQSDEFQTFRNHILRLAVSGRPPAGYRENMEQLVRNHFDFASGKFMRSVAYTINLMVLSEFWLNYREHPEKYNGPQTVSLYLSSGFAIMAGLKLISWKQISMGDRFFDRMMIGYARSLSLEDLNKLRLKSIVWKFWKYTPDALQYALGITTMISLIFFDIPDKLSKNKSIQHDVVELIGVGGLTVGSLMANASQWMLNKFFRSIALSLIRGGGIASLGLFFYDLYVIASTSALSGVTQVLWNETIKNNRVFTLYMDIPNLEKRIKKIDELLGPAKLENLSWRSVIPLYNMMVGPSTPVDKEKENIDAIGKMVDIQAINVDEKMNTLYDFEMLVRDLHEYRRKAKGLQGTAWNSEAWDEFIDKHIQIDRAISHPRNTEELALRKKLESVPKMRTEHIIEFYKQAKADPSKPYNSGMTGEEIAQQLEQGIYTPNLLYLDDDRWCNFVYLLPRNKTGYVF